MCCTYSVCRTKDWSYPMAKKAAATHSAPTYVILQRAYGNEDFLYRKDDGEDTISAGAAEPFTDKGTAHERVLTLSIDNPNLEYRLVQL